MVPLRTRLSEAARRNRNIRIEHLYSFRVKDGENKSSVESPSMIRLMPGTETNNEQLETQGGGTGKGSRRGSRSRSTA